VKRIIWAILISAALVFGFASCDDGAAGGGASWNPVGTWKCIINQSGPVTTYDAKLEIRADKTFERRYNGVIQQFGTYEYNNEGIQFDTTHSSGVQSIQFYRYDSTTKELTFRYGSNNQYFETYAKQ
jgi:hypothetical protein